MTADVPEMSSGRAACVLLVADLGLPSETPGRHRAMTCGSTRSSSAPRAEVGRRVDDVPRCMLRRSTVSWTSRRCRLPPAGVRRGRRAGCLRLRDPRPDLLPRGERAPRHPAHRLAPHGRPGGLPHVRFRGGRPAGAGTPPAAPGPDGGGSDLSGRPAPVRRRSSPPRHSGSTWSPFPTLEPAPGCCSKEGSNMPVHWPSPPHARGSSPCSSSSRTSEWARPPSCSASPCGTSPCRPR